MYRRTALAAIFMLLAGTAHADAVGDAAAWRKLTLAEQSAYAGGLVDGLLVGDGGPASAAYYLGATTCFRKLGLTPPRLARAISQNYDTSAAARSKPPVVYILQSVMRGTCLPFVNAERSKYKLPPLTTSDG